MNKKMLSAISFILLLSLVAQNAYAGWGFGHKHSNRGLRGSGDIETREFDLSDFDKIKLECGIDIRIHVGESFFCEVEADDNFFDEMKFRVRGRTLVLDTKRNLRPSDDMLLTIRMPELEGVSISGAGDIYITGISGDEFYLDISGAGDIRVEGEVDELDIHLSGAGNIDAEDLEARSADVRISGAGNAEITVTDEIWASISGVGDIVYHGDPEHEKLNVSGMGKIRHK